MKKFQNEQEEGEYKDDEIYFAFKRVWVRRPRIKDCGRAGGSTTITVTVDSDSECKPYMTQDEFNINIVSQEGSEEGSL